MKGLAYVDFSDDEHLAKALAKNKQQLLGKRVSIARSNPRQSKGKGAAGHSTPAEHGMLKQHFMFFTSVFIYLFVYMSMSALRMCKVGDRIGA